MNRLSVAIWLALCVALPASAQMYKWVDANGKVHYSDKPPPSNVKTERLREAAPAPTAPGANEAKDEAKKDGTKAGPKTTAEQEQAFRKRKAEEAKAQDKQAEEEKIARDKAENCRRAKAAAANLEMGGRQMRVDSQGERVFLTDEQIAEETARAKQEAAAACK
jgi:Domain of unknown function (DUF4124)